MILVLVEVGRNTKTAVALMLHKLQPATESLNFVGCMFWKSIVID
jgi:hypothetical protein